MTLSKERLEEIANLRDKKLSDGRVISPDAYSTVYSIEITTMARELLERRERDKQDPIGEVRRGDHDDVGCYPDAKVVCLHDQSDWEHFPDGFKLYAAPPAPVIPDEWPGDEAKALIAAHDIVNNANGLIQAIKAYRAAMLKGGQDNG